MTVVQELDRTLFDGYVKPKASAVMAIVRHGVLDPDMDWYETPRPTGRDPPLSSRRADKLTVAVIQRYGLICMKP